MNTDFRAEMDHVLALETDALEGRSEEALQALLRYYTRIVQTDRDDECGNVSTYSPIYNPLSRISHDEEYGPVALGWFCSLAPEFSEGQQIAIVISTLERQLDEPVSVGPLAYLWFNCWNRPNAQWVIWASYETEPDLFRAHHRGYSELAREEGLVLAEIDETEYTRWREEDAL